MLMDFDLKEKNTESFSDNDLAKIAQMYIKNDWFFVCAKPCNKPGYRLTFTLSHDDDKPITGDPFDKGHFSEILFEMLSGEVK